MPQVSIIIPAYNQEKYIGDCLNSVIRQTVTDWECIVVNDGSTDNTKNVVLSYMDHHPKIRMIEQTNKGLSCARNAGLHQARGEYIQFLDSDDAITENKLKVQLGLLAQTTAPALCYSNYYYSTENDLNIRSSRPWISPKFPSQNQLRDIISHWETKMTIPIHCFLFHADLLNKHNISFDEELPNHEDWDFLITILRRSPKIFYVNKELAIYRVNENSMARNITSMKQGFMRAIRKQQHLFPKNSIEYQLLSKKYKHVLHSYSLYNLGRRVKIFFPKLSGVKIKKELLKMRFIKTLLFIGNRELGRPHSKKFYEIKNG